MKADASPFVDAHVVRDLVLQSPANDTPFDFSEEVQPDNFDDMRNMFGQKFSPGVLRLLLLCQDPGIPLAQSKLDSSLHVTSILMEHFAYNPWLYESMGKLDVYIGASGLPQEDVDYFLNEIADTTN